MSLSNESQSVLDFDAEVIIEFLNEFRLVFKLQKTKKIRDVRDDRLSMSRKATSCLILKNSFLPKLSLPEHHLYLGFIQDGFNVLELGG